MPPHSPTELADPTAALTARAAAQRPDLAAAFADDGWLLVVIGDTLVTGAGQAFLAGDVALARPAVGRHPGDFVVYSERTATLAGLRHGVHFGFEDEVAA